MTTSPPTEIDELTAFANELADAAGAAILPMFRADVAVENKADKSAFDPVTAADRAGEQAIRDLILARYPDHSVRGEEFPPHDGTGPFTWLLDPIDGTKAFIAGLPVWATLIGLLKDGAPHIGVMDQPFIRERFVGTPEDAYVDGPLGRATLRTRDVGTLDQALLGTSHPANCAAGAERQRFDALEARVKHSRYGGDAYFYCLLAAGFIDVVTDPGMGDYDIVAQIPMIERAGGVVTTWDGGSAVSGGNILAAATPALHSAALDVLAG
ncbi:MAG: histidinol-phosphatase [Hyphomicrobiales bacterium]